MIDAAIIGLGRWGRNLVDSVAGASDKIRFVAGVTRTVERAADFARERGLALGSDLDAVLADPAVSAIVVATPHSMHAEHVRRAAAAGKHVYVEKPLALVTGDARAAVDACAATGVVLAVGFNRRFRPALARLAEIVTGGVVGEPLHLEGNLSGPGGYTIPSGHWRGLSSENPAGGMAARGNHVIDAMVSLCGPIEWVFAQSQRRVLDTEMDDTTSALLRFESGAAGCLTTLMATGETWRLRVLGSKGWAEMSDEHTVVLAPLEGEPTTETFPSSDTLRLALESFADAVTARGTFPVATSDAVHGVAVTEAIERSARSGAPITVSAVG